MSRLLVTAIFIALVAGCTEDNDFDEPRELGAVNEANPGDAEQNAQKPYGRLGHFKQGGSVEEHVAYKFEKLDANKDGAITADEAENHKRFAEKFADVDADSDGKITKEELTSHFKARFDGEGMHGKMGRHGMHGKFEGMDEPPCMKGQGFKHGGTVEEHVAALFEKLDTDKDGIISTEEGKGCEKFSSHFEGTDADGDGKVTKEELTAHVKTRFDNNDMPCGMGPGGMHGKFDGQGEPPCMKGRGFGHGHGGPIDEHVSRKFDMLDADKDGFISSEETQNHKWFAEKFASADADSDGKISKEELTQFFTDQRAKMQQAPEAEN